MNGLRPWEINEQTKESTDLSQSSGRIIDEGEREV